MPTGACCRCAPNGREVITLAILPDDVVKQVHQMFTQGVETPVELLLVADEPAGELHDLLSEVADQSDKLRFRHLSGVDARGEGLNTTHTPVVLLKPDAGEYSRARFLGIPSGHEFGVLIQDIIDLSQGTIHLSDETKAFLDGLQEDLHLMVFTTPT